MNSRRRSTAASRSSGASGLLRIGPPFSSTQQADRSSGLCGLTLAIVRYQFQVVPDFEVALFLRLLGYLTQV